VKPISELARDEKMLAAQMRVDELRPKMKAAIADHTAKLKTAAANNWPEDLVQEAERSFQAADLIRANIHAEVELIRKHLVEEYGISLEDLEGGKVPEFDSSFWKKDISATETTHIIEDSLARGFSRLLDLFPPAWVNRQYRLSQAELERRNAMPFVLLGSSRASEIIGAHPLGYAIFLTQLFLDKRPEIEVYDAAFLLPLIAAMCDRLNGIVNVKGGREKLLAMSRAPGGEFNGRAFELLVAGRAAEMGRDVEFVITGSEASPDLRINDLEIPLVVECKFQSRWSKTELAEIELFQTVFANLSSEYAQSGMPAALEIIVTAQVTNVKADEMLRDLRDQFNSLIPFGSRTCNWGTFRVEALNAEVDWRQPTRLYSPNYLAHVFRWEPETGDWDGICATVADATTLVTQRARLPFGIKWRLAHPADERSKARDVMRSLQEAANQVPVGEAGCLYVAFEDSHREALADMRTRRIIERLPAFYHRKRGANIQFLVVCRLYPKALGDGKADLIESVIPASLGDADDTWPSSMPVAVFTPK
jgi:hypothetical protein